MKSSQVSELLAGFRTSLLAHFESRLGENTQLRYARSRAYFNDWGTAKGIIVLSLEGEALDCCLARCILDAMEDDEMGRQFFNDMAAAVQKRTSLRLKLSWQVLAGWAKDAPPAQAEALPVEAALAAAVVCAACMDEPSVAIHIVLSFFGILRIGESLALRGSDVISGTLPSGQAVVILLIRISKRGFDERVVIDNLQAVAWIQKYMFLYPVSPDDCFAPCNYRRVYARLVNALKFLGLPDGNWRTHSLRRGGATYLAELGFSFGDIQLIGRWASDSSCREYIRRGQNALNRLKKGDFVTPLFARLNSISAISHHALIA
jgi:hypothetical protein